VIKGTFSDEPVGGFMVQPPWMGGY
jgi:hypothetical protein